MTKKIKVLMVDDETQFRETTRKILQKKGFEVMTAANGREALAQMDHQPDVMVLDIRMPELDGNATLAEIQQRFPGFPVIMLTGHGADESAKMALTRGAFDYLAKPCDINLLVSRIMDASQPREWTGQGGTERRVGDVMIPLDEYTTLTEDQTVAEGIGALRKSFTPQIHAERILETGHRSLLVFDRDGQLAGVLSIKDLLAAILPAYLTAPKPSTADSLQYSPMFWRGMFTREARRLSSMPVGDLMAPTPPGIDVQANLMEAAFMMVDHGCRRMVVLGDDRVVGVIREQDLFFELEHMMR
jgi:CheY-like chemotaxis protein